MNSPAAPSHWDGWPPVVLVKDSATRLVRVLDHIEPVMQRDEIAPWVLVGGLAVQIWVESDRATQDIDLSVLDRDTTAGVVRAQLAGATPQSNGVKIDGVKIDFLEAVDPALHPNAEEDASWFRNLTWYEALRLRIDRRVIATDGSNHTNLTVPAAPPGILLSMKLAAIANAAPGADEVRAKEKQGSDVYDVVTLVEAATAEPLVKDLQLADVRLLTTTLALAETSLVDDSLALAKRTVISPNSTVNAVSSARIEQCGYDIAEAAAVLR